MYFIGTTPGLTAVCTVSGTYYWVTEEGYFKCGDDESSFQSHWMSWVFSTHLTVE